jgi:hypothetical protein
VSAVPGTLKNNGGWGKYRPHPPSPQKGREKNPESGKKTGKEAESSTLASIKKRVKYAG